MRWYVSLRVEAATERLYTREPAGENRLTMVNSRPDSSAPARVTAALSAAVFVRRGDQILIIRRALGEMSGSWFIPGGGAEPGETLRETAVRELHEETGLVPSGPLEMVGHALIPAYGVESLIAFYACPCDEGEVVLNEEHTRARWIDAREYRERYGV